MAGTPLPIPAATLILMRDRAGKAPEILMIERSAAMRFAGGAVAFPGGRVDPGDALLAEGIEDGPMRIAAIRETIEETRIGAGLAPEPDQPMVARIAEGLSAGRPLPALIAAEGLAPDWQALVFFARWCPNFRETRNFDTHFYLAQTTGAAEPMADGAECVAAFWTTAADMLASGRPMLFPTRRTLERLARFASFAEAAEDARRHPPRLITPQVESRADGDWLTIPDDLGYPVTAVPLAEARGR